MFTIYFGIFALGRLAGSYVQKKISPVKTLVINSIAALVLLPFVIFSKGTLAIIALTLTGFFISIFFPTLYSIAIQGLGKLTGKASGILTMGMLGAALLPYLQGKIADNVTLQWSFAIGAVSHLVVLFFALKGHKIKNQ
jgi:FHS family L-fucose permease-like MFS transporter